MISLFHLPFQPNPHFLLLLLVPHPFQLVEEEVLLLNELKRLVIRGRAGERERERAGESDTESARE